MANEKELRIRVTQVLEGGGKTFADISKLVGEIQSKLKTVNEGGRVWNANIERLKSLMPIYNQMKAQISDISAVEKRANLERERAIATQQREAQKLAKAPQTQIGAIGSIQYMKSQMYGLTQMRDIMPVSNVAAVQAVNKEIDKLKKNIKEVQSTGGTKKSRLPFLLEMGENITAVTAGLVMAGRALKDFFTRIVGEGLKVEQLKTYFAGTADQLQKLKEATFYTQSEKQLFSLSNLALDLGISIDKQAQAFRIATIMSRKYGGDVQENFMGMVTASEGLIRGLRKIGIERAKFNEELAKAVKLEGGEVDEFTDANDGREITIKKLDAETQKRIRMDTILKLAKVSILDMGTATATDAEKMSMLSAEFTNAENRVGAFVGKGLVSLIESFSLTNKASTETAFNIGVVGKAIGALIIPISMLKIAIGGAAMKSAWVVFASSGLASIALISGGVIGLAALISSVKNALRGDGFSTDAWKEKTDLSKFRPQAEKDLLEKFGVMTGKSALFPQGRKVLPSNITQEDIDLRAGFLATENKKPLVNTSGLEFDKLDKEIAKVGKGGKSPKDKTDKVKDDETEKLLNSIKFQIEYAKEFDTLNIDLLETLKAQLKVRLDYLMTQNADEKTLKERLEVQKEIRVIADDEKEIKKKEAEFITSSIKEMMDSAEEREKKEKKIREDRDKYNEEIAKKEAELVQNDYLRQHELNEAEYYNELRRIKYLENATDEQKKKLSTLARKQLAVSNEKIFTDALVSSFNEAENIAGNIKQYLSEGGQEVYNAFTNAVGRMQAIYEIIKSAIGLFNSVMGLFNLVFGAATSGGGVGIPFKAKGGDIQSGRPYFVGDNPDGSLNKTTELFIPQSSGMILSASQVSRLFNARHMASGSYPSQSGTQNINLTVDKIKVSGNDLELILRRTNKVITKVRN